MSAPDDGGPAFPIAGQHYISVDGTPLNPHDGHGWLVSPSPGLSLRDWFAGQVCAATFSYPVGFVDAEKAGRIAAQSYVVADAMLEARKRT